MPLKRFVDAKQGEIARLEALQSQGLLPQGPSSPLAFQEPRGDFFKALQSNGSSAAEASQLAVIAEYKRASPSRGLICDAVEVEDAVSQYASNGAAALSILTEERYFQGQLNYLERAHTTLCASQNCAPCLPLLRKDFIFNLLQVHETAMTPAAAILLIVRLTPNVAQLRELRELAESYGMQAVVEIFSSDELSVARESGAKIIQVNARDLQTLAVDFTASISLAQENQPFDHEVWIAASGVSKASHMIAAQQVGYDAVLVGSALMEHGQMGQSLHQLLQGFKEHIHGEKNHVL
ncbi:MAG: indole-3-glycerol-phosphate synthase [Pseudomonadota bacterium]